MKRVFILAVDGTPFTFLQKAMAEGIMPNLANLAKEGQFRQMDSVIPPISSVAWASFMTGERPAGHGIFGFVERDPSTMDWYVPLSDRLQARTIWDELTAAGKRLFSMNVPLTYPPRPVNGIQICGFLGNDITKGTYPPEIGTLLKARGYRIDSDVELAKIDLSAFYEQLLAILDKRVETLWHFWSQEEWDFFMVHIMETDRLHHFFWQFMEEGHPHWAVKFYDFYRHIDGVIGQIVQRIPPEMPLLLLSDHGFTTLKKEFYLNRWLWENGFLQFTKKIPGTLNDLAPQTKAYSLYPGRIYIHLQGREKNGSVAPGQSYIEVRRHIREKLLAVVDPQSGLPIMDKVFYGEDLFEQRGLILGRAETESFDPRKKNYPDLIAVAQPGYDLKGNLWSEHLFEKTHFNGMHTGDDAFVLTRNMTLPEQRLCIVDLKAIIMEKMGLV